ncbi:hypothetical protein [Flavobacterium sp.]|uniref:hypothetical protein n=1 Tax=Flavobacterium sp. TaxID=239 RepID=UPI0026349137|nr:hypothetical protein [Flavobacterium sp.]
MKINTYHLLLSFFITSFIIEFNVVTFRTILDNHYEREPNLFGFPFICKTSIPWVNSMEQHFYLLGLIGNLIVGTIIFYIIVLLLNKIEIPKIIRKISNFIIMIFGIIAIISFFFILFNDKSYQWYHPFDTKYSKKEIEFFSTSNEKQ